MDPSISNKYLIRPDLQWDILFDDALLLRWENKAHVVIPKNATGLLDFLNRYTGGLFHLETLHTFESLEEPIRKFIETDLLRRAEDMLGDYKMPEWYSNNAVSIPHPRLTFMNHGYASLTSDDWDWMKPEDLDQRYQNNLVRQLVSGASLEGKNVLDIGCGRGGAASYMARYHNPEKVMGVDFCKENVELCTRIHDIDGLEFRQGDAQDLPLESDSFDVITNIESSHCYAAPRVFLGEVHRLLREDGHFCYTDCFTVAPRGDLIDSFLDAAGFKVESYVDITRNVISAIEQGRGSLKKLMREATADGIGADREGAHWINGVNQQYDFYIKGRLSYKMWDLTKK